MNSITPKRILICPLDWGLGHATRCIPIINEFIERDCKVVIASSGGALALLKKEYPLVEFEELVSYRATYGVRLPFMVNIFIQLPKFLKAINREHHQVAKIVTERKIDFVISDCRYGCWSTQVPSVFITHQINLLMPGFWKWIEPAINFFNHHQIKKFNQCWVPDFPGSRITGKLSDSKRLSVHYIGMLSRFKAASAVTPKKFDVLALISGPEPQRTAFEKQLSGQLLLSNKWCLLVRGLPESSKEKESIGNFEAVNHLASKELQEAIAASAIIVCRSGYSSVMDFARLGSRVIFIPTPGQTEQEYLAEQLEKMGVAFCQKQKNFDLNLAIKNSERYTGFRNQNFSPDLLRDRIDNLLK